MDNSASSLSPYRVLDLTDEKGFLCGKTLGDLGADVIKVEPPGGDPSRNIGPFYHDDPHPERSLSWFAYNANKRGITLNIETKDGQHIFKQLVKTADLVIESFPLGHMDKVGLSYPVLKETNPKIILVSITPFGQTGPYKDYKATDIVAIAMSALMDLCGDPDRPPVRTSFPQAYLHAGAEAALGSMMALYHRELNGEGQWVDVSIRESVLPALMNARLFWDLNQVVLKRGGSFRVGLSTEARQRLIWQCKDGYVAFVIFAGAFGAPTNRALVEWMESDGIADDFLKAMDWDTFDMAMATQEQFDRFDQPIGRFFLKHTKAELYEGARQRHIMLYPVATVEDILGDLQLKERKFWEELEHPELGTALTYPGAFAKLSQTPCCLRFRAPLIGEHNTEVYQEELGFSPQELVILKEGGII